MEARRWLSPMPASVSQARRFVTGTLERWGMADHIDAVELLTSELVTNAVIHARTDMELVLSGDGESLRVRLYDHNPTPARAGLAPPEATGGRGLFLVGALARHWGSDRTADGKCVWFELPCTVGSVL